jgi:hypothetical protein
VHYLDNLFKSYKVYSSVVDFENQPVYKFRNHIQFVENFEISGAVRVREQLKMGHLH